MKPVDYSIEDVFSVAMAPSFFMPDTYYIFRSAREQIVITITGNTFFSTAFLLPEEIKHIEMYYPFLDTLNYKVKSK